MNEGLRAKRNDWVVSKTGALIDGRSRISGDLGNWELCSSGDLGNWEVGPSGDLGNAQI